MMGDNSICSTYKFHCCLILRYCSTMVTETQRRSWGACNIHLYSRGEQQHPHVADHTKDAQTTPSSGDVGCAATMTTETSSRRFGPSGGNPVRRRRNDQGGNLAIEIYTNTIITCEQLQLNTCTTLLSLGTPIQSYVIMLWAKTGDGPTRPMVFITF